MIEIENVTGEKERFSMLRESLHLPPPPPNPPVHPTLHPRRAVPATVEHAKDFSTCFLGCTQQFRGH